MVAVGTSAKEVGDRVNGRVRHGSDMVRRSEKAKKLELNLEVEHGPERKTVFLY